jgi:HK97 family phage prohead protease
MKTSKNHPLIRTFDTAVEWRASNEGDGMSLYGYAARFNEKTEINSWEGRFDEVIAPGAFSKTISERTPVLQFDHGRDPAIGALPIGSIDTLREDSNGLYVEASLHANDHVRPVRDAIASGALDGMSFQFRVIRDDWDNGGDRDLRTIREVELFELGPVVFPAYATTSVGVRSLLDKMSEEDRQELAKELSRYMDLAGAAHEGTPEPDPADAASLGTSVSRYTPAQMRAIAYLATT